ncbi:S phase cyclin A-associated protein in the endoplasmic reticulum-like [Patella vulgata]|uniref:S phase cyclin A-associated protein in the endoplasmic reticulum-like n=1 Tax=Patella vulgata TaxID=6465 RepID=UPI002180168A|nr:S phase cyclin A-associated protein in the endoplasmic reticulum-like [Patella vulgata]
MSESRRKRYTAGPKSRSDNAENQYRNTGSGVSSSNHRQKNNHIGRMTSYDRVRKIVQEEGRTARNLVQYNVPLATNGERSSRSLLRHRKSCQDVGILMTGNLPRCRVLSVDSHLANRMASDMTKSPKSESGRKPDLRARYWKFLFDNLQRAVDAIYETCEQDESVLECKEVIMMLDQSARDFRLLIERLDMLRAFEESAKDGDRPTAIAWEVRKMSPGKMANHSVQGRCSPSPAQRVLNFSNTTSSQNTSISQPRTSDTTTPKAQTPPPKIIGNSWADKVKGIICQPKPIRPTSLTEIDFSDTSSDIGTGDTEGWETVQRGKAKAKNSPSQKSLENLSIQKSNESLKSNLFRSKSVPDSAKTTSKDKKSIKSKNEDIKNSEKNKRKDSEKENLPVEKTENKLTEPTTSSTSNLTPATRNTKTSSPKPKDTNSKNSKSSVAAVNSTATKTNVKEKDKKLSAKEAKNSKTVKRTVTSSPVNTKTESKIQKGNSRGKKICKDPNEIVNTMNTLKAALSQTSLHSGLDDNDNDDVLAEQLDTALACAQDAEESLSSQLEEEQQQALESAIEEEETWLKELARTASTEIEVDTESELTETMTSLESSQPTLDWETMEAEYEEKGNSRSWSEMVEEAEERTPGHGVHMHEKLSSPSRKRSPAESRRRHEEKQAKAQELREKLMQEKAERLRELSKKVEEVRAWKEELMKQRKDTMERKLQRAEEKRQCQLRLKSKKAHDEEAKANEIAFINSLEAQNKRHDILSKHQESEARLKEQAEERVRKMEEKQAKEAAVEERRRALEADRKAKLVEMQERRKKRDARIEHEREEREKERHEALKAKERDQKERLAALNAQQEAHIQELQKKIQQKQDESSQRHEEVLQQIREKAFEMSIYKHSTEDHNDAPQLTLYDKKKLCTICNTLIPSEVYLLSHLRGKKHQQALKDNNAGQDMSNQEIENFNLKNIVDVPENSTHPQLVTEKERLKSMKKRYKKLRVRMISRGVEYENALSNKIQAQDSTHKAKIQKLVKDISKFIQTSDTGPWQQNKVSAIDRAVGELGRLLEKKVPADLNNFRFLGCMNHLSKILSTIDDATATLPCVVPPRLLSHACEVYHIYILQVVKSCL